MIERPQNQKGATTRAKRSGGLAWLSPIDSRGGRSSASDGLWTFGIESAQVCDMMQTTKHIDTIDSTDTSTFCAHPWSSARTHGCYVAE